MDKKIFSCITAVCGLTSAFAVEQCMRTPDGSMLQNYYQKIADRSAAKRKAVFSKINSAQAAEKEVKQAAERVKKAFGDFPEDVPLDARSCGVIERDGVTIEKLLIQTRQNIHATLLVYRKSGAKDIQPGILLLCGHSNSGKASPAYQKLAYSLACMGMTAVIIDPLGQGERKLYPGLKFSAVREHNLTGKQLKLTGDFFGMYRVYDAKRAVDYMTTRKDIDSSRLGVAGVSGGGTLSSYTFAMDKRIAAAAPSCYITSYMRNFENELPVDSEQTPPGLWKNGGEMIDLIISRAPAPCLVLSVKNDFFDPRGSAEASAEAEKIYSLLGKKDNFGLFNGPGNHDLPAELREATCRFFARHFLGAKGDISVPEGKSYPLADTLVLNGKMTHELENEHTISQHIRLKMEKLAKQRKKSNPDIRKFLKKALQVPDEMELKDYRIIRGRHTRPRLSFYVIKTEPQAGGYLMRFNAKQGFHHLPEVDRAVLYVGHLDSETEMAQMEVDQNTVLYGIDVRGIGRSRSLTCDRKADFFENYDSDYFYDSNGELLGVPLAGGKVRDLLAAVKILKTRCRHLTVCGYGMGALIAAYAAGADNTGIDELVLNAVPESWISFANGADIRWPQSMMIRNSLKYFDLPELYDFLKKQLPLKINSYADQMMVIKE